MSDPVTYTAPATGAKFMLSDAKVRNITGPVGSGKSTVCLMEIFRRCSEMPKCKDGFRRSRWAIVRNTNQQLKSTTWKSWTQWFPPGATGTWKESEKTFFLTVGDIKAEILFLPLDTPDDAQRLLSLELTGVFFNEAREIAPELFTAAFGRLGRYPSKAMMPKDTPYWFGMIMDTNPPSRDSWLYETFEEAKPEGWEIFKQPGGLDPGAENRENLPETYYEDMMNGATEDWIDVHVHGKYGRSLTGRPVYEKSFKRSFHVSTETLKQINSPEYPLIIGMDFGRCYDDQTEVLTATGWKLFKDVQDSERVATMHPETRAFEYTDINFKVEFDYTGDMLLWQGTNINLCVTPEHRFPYTNRETPDVLRWASAEELSTQLSAHKYAIVAPRAWSGVMPECLPLNMNPIDYAELLGWWMSDGSLEQGTNRVSITQVKPAPTLDALMERMRGYGITPRSRHGWAFSNAELANHLREFGAKHTGERRVPDSIMNAPRDVILAFVTAYTCGDGNIKTLRTGGKEHTIWFSSKDTAGQFQELGQKLGWGSAVRWQKGGTSVFSDGREVVCAGGWVVQFKKKWERVELLPTQFSRVPYNGKIYCLNVPYHTLCVRRNGKVSWNGNTPAAVIGQRDHRSRLLVLDALYVENVGLETFITKHLKPLLAQKFPHNRYLVVGDPAGWAKSQINEESCFDVLKKQSMQAVRASTNDVDKRIEAVERLLAQQVEGQPMMLFSAETTSEGMKHLIAAMDGGYKYKRKTSGEYETSPLKDRYSHCSDATQYLCLGADLSGGSYGRTAARKVERVQYAYA